jgi:hypothetical protein
MTYKELLFKMADKGMLTLSTKKDDRGLFWAGMDNIEALEQQVDLGDFGDVIDSHEDIYGESDNYDLGEQVEQIVCDKQFNDLQGHIIARFNDIQ